MRSASVEPDLLPGEPPCSLGVLCYRVRTPRRSTLTAMTSFRSVTVERFRGLRDLDVEDLGQLNLITGLNGAGKSALLEAMFLLSAPEKPELSVSVLGMRSLDRFALSEIDSSQTPWDTLFPLDDETPSLKLRAIVSGGSRISLEVSRSQTAASVPQLPRATGRTTPARIKTDDRGIRGVRWVTTVNSKKPLTRNVGVKQGGEGEIVVEPPSAPPAFQTTLTRPHSGIDRIAIAERFGSMEVAGHTDSLVEGLRRFDPRVRAVRTIFNRTGPFLHVDIGLSRLLPITSMGGGFVSLAELLINMHECRNGVMLVDEIESGFHYAAMRGVWEVIIHAARMHKTQIVATTHSLEFIEQAVAAQRSEADEFRLFRLEREADSGRTAAVAYERPDVEGSLELGLDVR